MRCEAKTDDSGRIAKTGVTDRREACVVSSPVDAAIMAFLSRLSRTRTTAPVRATCRTTTVSLHHARVHSVANVWRVPKAPLVGFHSVWQPAMQRCAPAITGFQPSRFASCCEPSQKLKLNMVANRSFSLGRTDDETHDDFKPQRKPMSEDQSAADVIKKVSDPEQCVVLCYISYFRSYHR